MPTVWYILLAAMITVYVVLDGFDLGVGALHRVLARSDEEREATTGAIGPIWNGNEVWLIAGGGVLFLAFPRAYAAAFSGLYLGLILVLWLLIGRGLGLELRHQVDHPLWRIACDTVLWLASASLALVLGVALGNVVRGVPLRPDGYFHLALFDILNPYALAVGVFTLVLLAAHGANFLAFSAGGALGARARRLASRLWWAEVVLAAALAWPTVAVRPELPDHLADHPWRLIFPVLGLGALVALRLAQRAGALRRAFLASAAVLAGLLGTVAAGLYPAILPAHHDRPFGLTIDNAATSDHALRIAMWWWPVGIALATVYFVVAYRHFLGGRRPTIADV